MRISPPLLAAVALVNATGCSVYYDQQDTQGVTETVYDETLTDSLEEVFAECSEPLVIEPFMEEIDLAGSCELSDVDGAGPDTLLIALSANGPVTLDEPVKRRLYAGGAVIDDIPWPMQNCEVELDYTVRLDELRLWDLQASWQTHDGQPALRIDFDFDSWADAVEFRVDTFVDCPSRINERTLEAAFAAAIPSGWRQLSLSGLDLDIWVMLEDVGTVVAGSLDLDVDVSGIDTDTYISSLSSIAPNLDDNVLALLGFDDANMEAEIEDQLTDALSGLPAQVADLINGELPDGHIVCNVSESGGELTVVSDDGAERFPCLRTFIGPIQL